MITFGIPDPRVPVRVHHKEPAIWTGRRSLVSIVDDNIQREAALLELEEPAAMGADTPATAVHDEAVSSLAERNDRSICHRNLMNNLFGLPIPKPDFTLRLQIRIDLE